VSDTVITAEDLGKKYTIGHQRTSGDELAIRAPLQWLRSLSHHAGTVREEFWAIRDVSFSIKRGEAVGIVGRNGAGKSTLLKILSRITEPTTGRVRYRGRVASLLEVGTGFHAELSGRENIFLNAAILGMRRSEIARRFDEIVAFSEVEQFLDTPVKRYSSGMYVRLAFAVAAHLEPEIMIVDEVLAVGDSAFQRKCLGKMGNVVKEGRTVLFVTHNMAAVTALCTRGLLFDKGRLEYSGAPQAVVQEYLSRSHSIARMTLADRKDRTGSGRIRFTAASILNDRRDVVDSVVSGQDISICLEYEKRDATPLRNAVVQVKFFGAFGQPLFACLSRTSSHEPLAVTEGRRLICHIPRLPLTPGSYSYTIWCTISDVLEDYVADAGVLSVADGDYFGTGKLPSKDVGEFLVDHSWTVE
jgi:lipopolysaccharide transport system ATP-binding protein